MTAFAIYRVEQKLSKMIKFYKRYVDDIFIITNNKAEADNFLERANSLHEKIKFTIEHEKDNKLAFLDTVIKYYYFLSLSHPQKSQNSNLLMQRVKII